MSDKGKSVTRCRVCDSANIVDLGIERNFYLLNLDTTATLPYAFCLDCQFIFQAKYLGDEFISNYYSRSLMFRRPEVSDIETVVFGMQADFVSRQFDLRGKKVLEIGADTGQFLAFLHFAFNCDVYFDELSETARGFLIERGYIKDFRALEKRPLLDLIVVRHTLEHIHDLSGFLKSLMPLMAKSGHLFIEVPDWSFLDELTDPYHFEHLNQFSSANLTMLLSRNGFIVERLEMDVVPLSKSTPNRVLRVLATKSPLAPVGNKAFKEDVLKHDRRLSRQHQHLEKYLESIPPEARIALSPASHMTFDLLGNKKLRERNIVGLFDNDPKKIGKKPFGLEIRPTPTISSFDPEHIFVLTIGGFANEIVVKMKALCPRARVIAIDQLSKQAETA